MDAEDIVVDTDTEAEVHRVQRIIQWLLRGGLIIAVVLMATGLAMKIAAGARHAPGVKMFSIGSTGSTADTLMALGVLVLALTPAFRVVALVVLWARERDWRFVAVACLVVVTLSIAVLIGHG